jgi:hypothetical protein
MAPLTVNAGPECPQHLVWKHPGLPREWALVLERNEDAMRPEPLPGYVWLDTRGKRTHVWVEHLEIRDSDG